MKYAIGAVVGAVALVLGGGSLYGSYKYATSPEVDDDPVVIPVPVRTKKPKVVDEPETPEEDENKTVDQPEPKSEPIVEDPKDNVEKVEESSKVKVPVAPKEPKKPVTTTERKKDPSSTTVKYRTDGWQTADFENCPSEWSAEWTEQGYVAGLFVMCKRGVRSENCETLADIDEVSVHLNKKYPENRMMLKSPYNFAIKSPDAVCRKNKKGNFQLFLREK